VSNHRPSAYLEYEGVMKMSSELVMAIFIGLSLVGIVYMIYSAGQPPKKM